MTDPVEPRHPHTTKPESICCVCGRELVLGAGRFLLEVGAVCLECYDAGRRTPPPS